MTVESLNDALAWLTIEGAGAAFEAPLWFSAYGRPRERVTNLDAQWNARLQRILGKSAAN